MQITPKSRQLLCAHKSALLSWLGADQHPERSPAVEALHEDYLHFRERPEEHQVSIYSKQFFSHFQASHLSCGKKINSYFMKKTCLKVAQNHTEMFEHIQIKAHISINRTLYGMTQSE